MDVADQIQPELLAEKIVETHQGDCSVCGKSGPVDIQFSHTIWSAVLVSSYKSTPSLCCKLCGIKKKTGGIAFSFFLGWWGIPWGIIMTPVQIIKNTCSLFNTPNPNEPSERLQKFVKLNLANMILNNQNAQSHQGTSPNEPK